MTNLTSDRNRGYAVTLLACIAVAVALCVPGAALAAPKKDDNGRKPSASLLERLLSKRAQGSADKPGLGSPDTPPVKTLNPGLPGELGSIVCILASSIQGAPDSGDGAPLDDLCGTQPVSMPPGLAGHALCALLLSSARCPGGGLGLGHHGLGPGKSALVCNETRRPKGSSPADAHGKRGGASHPFCAVTNDQAAATQATSGPKSADCSSSITVSIPAYVILKRILPGFCITPPSPPEPVDNTQAAVAATPDASS